MDLLHIFHGLHDPRRLRALADFFAQHAATARQLAETAECSLARSAELHARLAAWRNQRQPSRVVRDRNVMKLARRGFSDAEIGARLGISERTVRRIIKKELRR